MSLIVLLEELRELDGSDSIDGIEEDLVLSNPTEALVVHTSV